MGRKPFLYHPNPAGWNHPPTTGIACGFLSATKDAGRLLAEPARVERGGDVLGPGDRRMQVGGELVDAGDEHNAVMAVDGRGHTIAHAVDVHNLARLGNTVCRAQICLGMRGALTLLGGGLLPMSIYLALLGKGLIQSHGLDSLAAADAHRHTPELAGNILGRLSSGFEIHGVKTMALQVRKGKLDVQRPLLGVRRQSPAADYGRILSSAQVIARKRLEHIPASARVIARNGFRLVHRALQALSLQAEMPVADSYPQRSRRA